MDLYRQCSISQAVWQKCNSHKHTVCNFFLPVIVEEKTENRNIWSMCDYNNTLNGLNYLNVSEASALCPLLYCYKTEDSTSLTAPSV